MTSMEFRRAQRKASVPRGDSGATMVEFAISMGLFMLVLLFLIDCALMGFRMLSLQYAMSRAARYAATFLDENGNTMTVQTARARARQFAAGVGVTLNDADLGICSHLQLVPPDFKCPPVPQCTLGTSQEEEFVVVRADVRFNFFLSPYWNRLHDMLGVSFTAGSSAARESRPW